MKEEVDESFKTEDKYDTDDEEEYDSDDEEFYPYVNGPFLGSYKCGSCKNKWKSSHSWKNTFQKCKFCMKHIFPHHQVFKIQFLLIVGHVFLMY